MATNIIKEHVDIHDYEISSYQVDIYNHKLQIFAEYSETEKKSVTFTNLLAHHFENVTYSNILFDITQITIDCFIETYKEMLEESLRSAFPVWGAKNCEDLRVYLKENEQKTFIVYSSLGLSGFVIAKEISIVSIKD